MQCSWTANTSFDSISSCTGADEGDGAEDGDDGQEAESESEAAASEREKGAELKQDDIMDGETRLRALPILAAGRQAQGTDNQTTGL